MKRKEISALETKVVNLLPMLQMDIWKEIGLTRRECSRLLITLEKKGSIKRTKVKTKSGGSFMVEKLNGHIKIPEPKTFSALLSNRGKFSPCAGCGIPCKPATCERLDYWVKN